MASKYFIAQLDPELVGKRGFFAEVEMITIEDLEKQKDEIQASIKAQVEMVAQIEIQIEKARRDKKMLYPVSSDMGKAYGLKSREYKQCYALERWAKEHGYVEYKPLKKQRKVNSAQVEMNVEVNEDA